MLDFTIKGGTSTPELTSEIAQAIYTLIVNNGNADLAFKNQADSLYDPEHFDYVDKEASRLFSEMNTLAYGGVYVKTTETAFKAEFSSDYLDVDTVYSDWKGSKTWTEIKDYSPEVE